MDHQIKELVRYCLAYQDSMKAHKINHLPEQPILNPQLPWSKVALDICGPFESAPRHQRFIAILIDHHTKYPEVLLTNNTTSGRIIKWLRQTFARFGNPDTLLSDNGPQVLSEEMENFLASCNIKHETTAVYNPQQNGMVEIFN